MASALMLASLLFRVAASTGTFSGYYPIVLGFLSSHIPNPVIADY
jgi:hypothetical protein